MAYTKINWIDNETKLVADNFNAMEDGIAQASTAAESAAAEASKANEEVSKLSGQLGNLADEVSKIDTSFKTKHDERISALEKTAPTIEENQKKIASQQAEVDKVNPHITNASNPHGVTAAQVGAYAKSEAYSRIEVDGLIQDAKEEILETQEFISCGTEDPDSTTTGTFYFKYAT
jgi:chromosome segregation ATPase